MEHTFIVGAFLNNVPWRVEITNLELVRRGYPKNVTRLHRSFETFADRVGAEGVVMGVGRRNAISKADIETLRKAAAHRPDNFENYLNLLAEVIRRCAARQPDYISDQAHGVYLPPTPVAPPGPESHSKVFDWGSPVPQETQPGHLLFGIDAGSMMRRMLEGLRSGKGPEGFHEEAIRLEAGLPVLDQETGATGRVAADPAKGAGPNDIGVYWDSEPKTVKVIDRSKVTVLYPGHPALRPKDEQ
jgi:hypothetical protein